MFEWDHLSKAGASWFKHFYIAVYYAGIAFLVGILGLIHAVFPFMFGFLPYKLAKKITDGTEKNFPECVAEPKPKPKKMMME
jgi:hypothetical protein